MSGPYAAGLGMKKRTISHVSTTDDEENEEKFFSSNDAMPVPTKRRRVTHADAEVVPKFRPEDSNSSVSSWLHKIDQLGDVYGWDATEKQFVMQLRLRGSARRWYDELENYNLRWEDWKSALRTAFPRSTDYVDRLEAMLSRTKRDTETMTNYFHDKVSLLKKCEIEGESAISCIIRGLPVELRANAKAYQCETPELLYYGYLSSLENYRKVEAAASTRRSTWRRASPRSNGQVERVNRTIIDGLNTMSESESTWDDKLADIVWGINNTPNATTSFPPFKLMFGHENSRLPAYPTNRPTSQEEALKDRRENAKLHSCSSSDKDVDRDDLIDLLES
ncbi:uncharacterized protein LOC125491296 [Plutella xylostella]|nr:uncharacterized protein LOC125491296 [Plutella xylostella]